MRFGNSAWAQKTRRIALSSPVESMMIDPIHQCNTDTDRPTAIPLFCIALPGKNVQFFTGSNIDILHITTLTYFRASTAKRRCTK